MILKYLTKYYGIVLIIIASILAFSVILEKCDDSKEVIERIDVNMLRRDIIDSLKTEEHKKILLIIDSVNKVREKEISVIAKKNTQIEKERNILRANIDSIYAANDTLNLDNCKKIVDAQGEIIEKQDTIIENKNKEIDLYRLSLYDMNRKYELENKENSRIKEMYSDCTKDLNNSQEELRQKNNWWNRNEKWIFLGLGAIGGILIAK